ncbi:unnamed protein product [Spirodela intermedia]|uniref:DYW domain-containing protein n=1 Tax=Spirodela intermedia TaxID=51605 RepID=A0A7I8J936_SPIIN|nr:unnamed protein product [Spirodela intermedia]CAA6666728.1 unnamed protein product [Spirodela intermedia]
MAAKPSGLPVEAPESRNRHGESRPSHTGPAIVARVVSEPSEFSAICSAAESGSMEEALRLFESVRNPGSFLWNAMIRGYAGCGRYEDAIGFYWKMQVLGVRADRFTYTFVIKSCSASLLTEEGLKCHGALVKVGLHSDVFISNSLIVMYSEFGEIDSAERVFNEMPLRDLVSWNSMVRTYVSSGKRGKALSCLRSMRNTSSLEPDRIGIITALKACSTETYPKQGKEIHCYALRHGYGSDSRVCTSLIDMYCKSGNMISAERLFQCRFSRSVVTWNALIYGYTSNNHPSESLGCIIRMQYDDVKPDAVTMVSLLPSCSQLSNLSQGKSIHGAALRRGFLPHLVLETSLVDMYAKCGDLTSAERVFSQMTERNLVSWNTMINAHIHNDQNLEAVELFLDLQEKSLQPDIYTISSIANPCLCCKIWYSSNTFILNSIIYLYAKCGDLRTSRRIFEGMLCRDTVSWNAMIMACAIHGEGSSATELFSRMQRDGPQPNGSTFVSILSACSISGLADEGWMYFNLMQQKYGLSPQIEHYGCMVDLIGRTGDLDFALSFVERIPLVPTARIWGSLLAASRKSKRIDVAEAAAEKIFPLKHDNTGCYIILHNLYTDLGRWDDAEKVRSSMQNHGLLRTTARSVVELDNKAYCFINGDKSHAEASLTHEVSDLLSKKIGEAGEVPSAAFNVQEALAQKKNSPCQHSVRLAVCFGLISSSPGTPVLVKKNVRICDDCHLAIKQISEVCRRHITVGDSRIYHHFKEGSCSCGDYW